MYLFPSVIEVFDSVLLLLHLIHITTFLDILALSPIFVNSKMIGVDRARAHREILRFYLRDNFKWFLSSDFAREFVVEKPAKFTKLEFNLQYATP